MVVDSGMMTRRSASLGSRIRWRPHGLDCLHGLLALESDRLRLQAKVTEAETSVHFGAIRNGGRGRDAVIVEEKV